MSARWESDERGDGVASAGAFAPHVERLAEAARLPTWVAEEPEQHLLHHVERALGDFELVQSSTAPDGTFELRLRRPGAAGHLGEIRAAVFALVGSFSELSTFVRQVGPSDGVIVYEVVTGFLEGDSRFAPHGHAVRISVELQEG